MAKGVHDVVVHEVLGPVGKSESSVVAGGGSTVPTAEGIHGSEGAGPTGGIGSKPVLSGGLPV
jgi:hypothetical protein